jgi:hypothetical protein
MNQLWGQGKVRDYWPQWPAPSIQNTEWLNNVDCFRPKFLIAPRQGLADIPASGYVITTFALVPGTWVIGFSQVNSDALDFQVTDLASNFKFFSAPVSAQLMAPAGNFAPPYWLPEPYLMAAPATLRVEAWNNNAADSSQSQLVVHVIEPREV